MNNRFISLITMVFAAGIAGLALASGLDDALIKRGDSTITHRQFDARVTQIPLRDRYAFIRDGHKVDRMLNQLMLMKLLADEARTNGYEKDQQVEDRMALAAEKALADAWLDAKVAKAPDADYESLAQEVYLSNPEIYKSKETVDITHLLIATSERSDEEAMQIARDLLNKTRQNPAGFDDLVKQHSEDKSVANNQGKFKTIPRGRFVKPFEDASFALANPGDISDLVKTQFGYHIIRLDGHVEPQLLPFEAVKPALIQAEKTRHRDRVRNEFVSQLLDNPLEIPDGAIEVMVKRHLGENFERAPDYSMLQKKANQARSASQ